MPKKSGKSKKNGIEGSISLEDFFGSKFYNNKLDDLKVVAFNLDYVLWPFTVNYDVFSIEHRIIDRWGTKFQYYEDVPEILNLLLKQGYELAIASNSENPKRERDVLQLLDLDKYFKYKEIFQGRIDKHFSNIKKAAGCEYKEMMFYDTRKNNIEDASELGVVSILLINGIKKYRILSSLRKFPEDKFGCNVTVSLDSLFN